MGKSVPTIFFGSTNDSVLVLEQLVTSGEVAVAAVVTQPPRPVGRSQTVTPTPVARWAEEHTLPCLSFPSNREKSWLYENEQTVIDTLDPFGAELLISASYGQKIPSHAIADAKYGGLNVHPSMLPRWRGADPVPWAILTGDHQVGVSVVTLSGDFDQGKIIAQKKIPVSPKDTSDPLRTRLFTLGAQLLVEILPGYLSGSIKGKDQDTSKTPYARRFTRQDGYEPWEAIHRAFEHADEAVRIERKFRALTPWPGLWTTIPIQRKQHSDKHAAENSRRLKILSCHLAGDALVIDLVQLEGKNPVSWEQFTRGYLPGISPKGT